VCSPQEGHCEKRYEIQGGAAKKWLDDRLMAKILIMTILVNLVPNLTEMWRRQHKFT